MSWLSSSFQDFGSYAVTNLPRIVIPLAILIGGWLLALIARRLVYAALCRTALDDRLSESTGMDTGDHRIERIAAKGVYYVLLGFVLVAFFTRLRIDAVSGPILTVLDDIANAVPSLIKATLVGVIGFVVAVVVRKLLATLLDKVGFDRRLRKLIAVDSELEKEPASAPSHTLVTVIYAFILLVTAVAVLEALRIGVLAQPLSAAFATIALYLPKVVAALLLLLIGYVLARFVGALVAGLLARLGLDRGMTRLGLGKALEERPLSGILGTIAMAFILLHFAISAVGRLDILEISQPLGRVLGQIYAYLPKLLVGGLLMVIGVYCAQIVGNLVGRLLAAMGFNTLMLRIGVIEKVSDEAQAQQDAAKQLVAQRREPGAAGTAKPDPLLASTGRVSTPADVAGVAVNVVIVLLFARQVLATIELQALAGLVDRLLLYLPSVLIAAVILGAGLWAGRWAHKRIDELTHGSSDRLMRPLGAIARVAIVTFAVMMGLQQLGVGRQLLTVALAVVLGAVALAAALAFGLGGREVASRILQKEYGKREGGRGSSTGL